jgi:hypothetical protein
MNETITPPEPAPTDTTTYLVVTNAGEYRITVPSAWKVTFGPVAPNTRHGGGDSMYLRFYEAKERQRACFSGVRSFRDLSLPTERRLVSKKQHAKHEQDGKGSHVSEEAASETERWEPMVF